MPYSGEMITSERIADAESFELQRFVFRMEKDGEITEPLIYEVEYDSPEPRACRNLRAFAERDAAQVATVRLVMNPGTAEEEAFLHAALDSVFHLPRSIVSDSLLAVYRVQDSIANRNANIDQSDLFTVRSNPRVIMLNACFNGSFHNPEGYVAGVHIFGPGRCVAVQGNTVNVLQDKWEDRLLGYLAQGVRIGLWQREFPLLESHIIGDPTFRFRPADKAARKHAAVLTNDLLRRRNKAAVWQKYLRSDDPNDRAAGILHLKDSRQALRLLREDPSRIQV